MHLRAFRKPEGNVSSALLHYPALEESTTARESLFSELCHLRHDTIPHAALLNGGREFEAWQLGRLEITQVFLWYEAEGGSTPLIRAEENELATLIKKGRWSCCPELHRAWGEAIIMRDLGWPPATAEGWDVCARVRMCFRITRDIPAWKERLWQHISLCFEHQLSGIFFGISRKSWNSPLQLHRKINSVTVSEL